MREKETGCLVRSCILRQLLILRKKELGPVKL